MRGNQESLMMSVHFISREFDYETFLSATDKITDE